jgi:hypothetical protein
MSSMESSSTILMLDGSPSTAVLLTDHAFSKPAIKTKTRQRLPNHRRGHGQVEALMTIGADVVLVTRDRQPDVVNSPPHYARLKPQPIEVMAAWNLPCFPSMAIKYVARAGFKAGVDATVDYRKAISYLEREIARLQGKSVVKDVPNS